MVLFCLRLVRGFIEIWPDCPLSLRLLASPADAGRTPTTKKKGALKAPNTEDLFPYRLINEV